MNCCTASNAMSLFALRSLFTVPADWAARLHSSCPTREHKPKGDRDREAEMTKMRALMKTGMFLAALGVVVVLSSCGSNPVSSSDPGSGTYVPPGHAGAKGDNATNPDNGSTQK